MFRLGFWLALLGLLLVSAGAQSQEISPSPLFIALDGVLWAWNPLDNTIARLSDSGYIHQLAMSPDGSRLAYIRQDTDGQYDALLPSEVWVMDVVTGQTTALPGGSEEAVFRTSITWSPDGTQLAWNENHQLAIHDFGSGQTLLATTLPGGGGDAGHIAVASLNWGESGIFTVHQGGIGAVRDGLEQSLTVYEATGKIIFTAEVGSGLLKAYLRYPTLWIQQHTTGVIALGYRVEGGNLWDLIDPVSAAAVTTTSIPELFSPFALESSTTVLVDSQNQWWLIDSSGALTPLDLPAPVFSPQITLSPDGRSVAYAADGVYVRRDGETRLILGDSTPSQEVSLAWSAPRWRLRTDERFMVADLPSSALPSCPPGLPINLVVGSQGQLVSQDVPLTQLALYRHSRPFRLAQHTISVGDVFTVLDGPVCPPDALDFVWWQVEHDGAVGWIPDGGYWQLEGR